MVRVQAFSSAYHHIQVGGPANKITTGEIRIDLPSESFHNLKFNITPYSLQNEYSPYYDQYSAGYQPSAYTQPKTQTNKQSSLSAYKSVPQGPYKPAPVVSYKPSPSIPHPVYSYPQTTYNQPQVSYIQPTYTQPKVLYNQPQVSYNQPKYTQPKVSNSRPSYNPIQAIQPSYQPQNTVFSYKPIKATALSTKPDKVPSEGDYSSYPYPYHQTVYRQPATQKQITSVVDLKDTEEITESVPVEDVTEDERIGKIVTGNDAGLSDVSENTYTEFNSSNFDRAPESDSETEEAREAKTIDTDVEDFDQNSVESVASSTLLPESIPIIFEEAGASTTDNTLLRESTTLFTTSSTTKILQTTTVRLTTTNTARLTTTTTTTAPTTTRSTATTTAPTTSSTASSIRRRPVISLFHDLTSSTSPPRIKSVTPPGDIGQSILDNMRSDTLTVQKLLDSEEEITLKTSEDKNNTVKSKDEDQSKGELLEKELMKMLMKKHPEIKEKL